MQIKSSGIVLRSLSFCTLFVFLITSVSWSTPALPFQEIPPHSIPPDVSVLTVPPELASVQEIFKGEAGKPTVILVQDAHCILDAQKHIAGLIDLFQKQHGLNLVALEGGSGKLDPLIFRAFPDRKAKESVFNEYLKRGEISGAEWASILNEKPAEFWGVEDKKLYRLNKDAFVRTQRERANLLHELARIKKLLDEFKRELYSSELKELDELTADFRRNHTALEPLLAFLAKFEPYNAYPTISKLLAISEDDLKLQKEKILAELAAEDLFSEIEEYVSSVRDKLSLSEDVRQLIDLYDRLELLTDLAGLQMSRPAFEKYRLNRASYMPEKFQAFAERHGKFIDLAWNLDAHEEFYAVALKRDEAMYENVRNLLVEEGERFALFVAGGFHSSGISHKLKKEGISYIILTPRIDFMPEETTYEDVMNGEVSYKRFLNRQNDTLAPELIVSAPAFSRDAGLKLARTVHDPEVFKSWHDDIIRILASRGRILKSGHYTRFVRTLYDLVMKNAEGEISDAELQESIENLLLKYTRPYFDRLKQNMSIGLDRLRTEMPTLFPNIDPKLALDSLANVSSRTQLTNYFERWDAVVQEEGEKGFPEIPRASIFEGMKAAEDAIRGTDPRLSPAGVRAVAGDLLEHLESRNVAPDVLEPSLPGVSNLSGFGAMSFLKNRYVRNIVLVGMLGLAILGVSAWKASQLEAASIHTISLSQFEVILQKPNENKNARALVPGPMYTEQSIKGVPTKVPTGWLVYKGKEVNPFNKNSKGLAVQKAVFVIDKRGKMYIGRALGTYQETLAAIGKALTVDDVEYAFQAGPMAMEDGKINDKLLDWLNSWSGRKVLIGIKENGDLVTREVFGLDPFGSDGPSGAHVMRILENMKREGVTHVIFGDGGSTFSGDTGIFGKPPVYELGVVEKDSIAQPRPGGFGAADAEHALHELLDEVHAVLGIPPFSPEKSGIELKYRKDLARKHLHKRDTGWSIEDRISLLMSYFLDYSEKMESIGEGILARTQKEVLDPLMQSGDEEVFVLPSVDDWLTLQMMYYVDDAIFENRAKQMAKWSLRASALLLALMGPHLRRQHDDGVDRGDMVIIPILMSRVLPRLEELLDQTEQARANGQYEAQFEREARALAGVLLNSLMFIPNHPFHSVRKGAERSFAFYRDNYFNVWMEQIELLGIQEPSKIIQRAMAAFPDLFPNDHIPPFLLYWNDSAHATGHIARVIKANQFRNLTGDEAITLWDTVSGSEKADAYRERTQEKVTGENPALVTDVTEKYFALLYPFLLSGGVETGETLQATAKTGGFGAATAVLEATEDALSTEHEAAERILNIFSKEIESANRRIGRLRFQPDRGSQARFLTEFFLSRAHRAGLTTLGEYEEFLSASGPVQSKEKKAVLEKLTYAQFTSRASNDFELPSSQLNRLKELLMEALMSRIRTSNDRTLRFRVVGVGKNARELRRISDFWREIAQAAKTEYSEVLGKSGLDDWDVRIDVYDLDAKTLETAERWLGGFADKTFADTVRLHWMDVTDEDYIRNQWLPEKADIIFIRNVLRGNLRLFPEMADFFLRGDLLNQNGLLITDRLTASALLSLSEKPVYVVQDREDIVSWTLQLLHSVKAPLGQSTFDIQELASRPLPAYLTERISGKSVPVTVRLANSDDAYRLASEFYFAIDEDVNANGDRMVLVIESDNKKIEGILEIRRPAPQEIDGLIPEHAVVLAKDVFILENLLTRRPEDVTNSVLPRFNDTGALLMAVAGSLIYRPNRYLYPNNILLFVRAFPIFGEMDQKKLEDFYLNLGMKQVSQKDANRLYWEKADMKNYVDRAFLKFGVNFTAGKEKAAAAGFGVLTIGTAQLSAGEADFFNLLSNMAVSSLKSLHHSIYVDFDRNSDFYSGSMVNILRNGRSWERLFDGSYPTSESIRGRVRVSGDGRNFLYQVNGTAPLDLVRQQEIIRSALEAKGEEVNPEEIIRHKDGLAEALVPPWDSPEISAAAKVAAKVIAAFRAADGGPLVLNGKKGKPYTFDMEEIEDYRFGPDYPEGLSDTTDYLIADRASVSFSLMVREEGLEEPVGKAFFSVSPHPSNEQAVRAYWSNIEVHPEHRGRGGVAHIISVQLKDVFPESSILESIPTSADILILLAEKILADHHDPKVEEALPILRRELHGEVFSDDVRGPINAHILGTTAVLFSRHPDIFNNAEFFAELDKAYFSRYFGFRTVRVELDKRNRLPVFVREKSQISGTAEHGFGATIAENKRAASVMEQLKRHLENMNLTWNAERYGKIAARVEEKKRGKRPSGKKVFSVSLRDDFVADLSDDAREELSILKKKQPRDSFYPPMGSLGQLALYTTLIAGRPAIVILETQPSDGFRSLNRRARRALRRWSAESVRSIGEWGEQNDVLVFATSDQVMGSLYARINKEELHDYYEWPYSVANAGLWKKERRLLSAAKYRIVQNGEWFAWAGNDYSHFDVENKTHWLNVFFGPDSKASKELANLEILGSDRDIYENAFHALAMSLTADDLPDLISRSIQLKEMSSGFASFISALIKNLDAISGFKIMEERLRDLGQTVSPSLSAEDKQAIRNIVHLLDTFYAHEIGGEVFFGLRETFQVFRKNLDNESQDWFDDVTEMIRTRLRSSSAGFGAENAADVNLDEQNGFLSGLTEPERQVMLRHFTHLFKLYGTINHLFDKREYRQAAHLAEFALRENAAGIDIGILNAWMKQLIKNEPYGAGELALLAMENNLEGLDLELVKDWITHLQGTTAADMLTVKLSILAMEKWGHFVGPDIESFVYEHLQKGWYKSAGEITTLAVQKKMKQVDSALVKKAIREIKDIFPEVAAELAIVAIQNGISGIDKTEIKQIIDSIPVKSIGSRVKWAKLFFAAKESGIEVDAEEKLNELIDQEFKDPIPTFAGELAVLAIEKHVKGVNGETVKQWIDTLRKTIHKHRAVFVAIAAFKGGIEGITVDDIKGMIDEIIKDQYDVKELMRAVLTVEGIDHKTIAAWIERISKMNKYFPAATSARAIGKGVTGIEIEKVESWINEMLSSSNSDQWFGELTALLLVALPNSPDVPETIRLSYRSILSKNIALLREAGIFLVAYNGHFLRAMAEMDAQTFQSKSSALQTLFDEFKIKNDSLEEERRISETHFREDLLSAAFSLEILLPGSIENLTGLIRSGAHPGGVTRLLEAKIPALSNEEVTRSLSVLIERIKAAPQKGRRQVKIDLTAFYKIIDTTAGFIEFGAKEDLAKAITDLDPSKSLSEINRALIVSFLQVLAKSLGLENVIIKPEVFQTLYLPFFSRITQALHYVENHEPAKKEKFEGLLRAMLEDRFLDFIENISQTDEVGREIAEHNAGVREGIASKNIDVKRWLGKDPQARFGEEQVIYQEPSEFKYNPVGDVQAVMNYILSLITKMQKPESRQPIIAFLESQGLMAVYDEGEKKFTKLTPIKREKRKDIISLIARHEFIDGLDNALQESKSPEIFLEVPILETFTHLLEAMRTLRERLSVGDYQKDLEKLRRSFRIRPIVRSPGHDLFLGDFTGCCIAMNSDQYPDAMVDRLIDEGINVIEVIDDATDKTMAVAWIYLAADGSLVIQNLEINSDYEYIQPLMEFIGDSMIAYAKGFAEYIGSPRLFIGIAEHGKYHASGFIRSRFGEKKISFSQDKIGGYLGKRYYLDTTEKAEAYLAWEKSTPSGHGFGAGNENKFVPANFGKGEFQDFQIGGKMFFTPPGASKEIEVRKIQKQVVPLEVLNRFTIAGLLTFRIIALDKAERLPDRTAGGVRIAAPAAGYRLQIYYNRKWFDLSDINLEDGVPIIIKRTNFPKTIDPIVEIDLGQKLPFQSLTGDHVSDLRTTAIYWNEGPLTKTAYLPPIFDTHLIVHDDPLEFGDIAVSRGVERTEKRPGVDFNTQTYLEGYLQPGHVEIEIMEDSVRFSDLGSTWGTQIEVDRKWLNRARRNIDETLMEQASRGDVPPDRVDYYEDLTGVDKVTVMDNEADFPYEKPFSVAAVVNKEEMAKVFVRVENKILHIRYPNDRHWRPFPNNKYVASQLVPVAGQTRRGDDASLVMGSYHINLNSRDNRIIIHNFAASRLRVVFEPNPGDFLTPGSAGFGAIPQFPAVDAAVKFRKGFVTIRDAGFIKRGEPVYLLGEGAPSAAEVGTENHVPRSVGGVFENFNGFNFDERDIKKIYVLFSSPDEWEKHKDALRYILDTERFAGRVFIEIKLGTEEKWTPESPLWKKIQSEVETLKQADTHISSSLFAGPEGFNVFVIDVSKDKSSITGKFEGTILALSADRHLIRNGDSILVIAANAGDVNPTILIKDGYVAVVGLGLKQLVEDENIPKLPAYQLARKILVRFTRQEWESNRRKLFEKLLTDDDYYGQVFIEIEGFQKEDMFIVRELLRHLNGRATFHSWDFNEGTPREFSGFIIEISEKPQTQLKPQPQAKPRPRGTWGFGVESDNDLYSSISGVLMSLAEAHSIIEASTPKTTGLNFWKLDDHFVLARSELQNGKDPQNIRRFLTEGRDRVSRVLGELRSDLQITGSRKRMKYVWGLVEYELEDLERALADTLALAESAVVEANGLSGFGFENSYQSGITELARELTGIIKSGETFDENIFREKLESALPDLRLSSKELEDLWVELSWLEFLARPTVRRTATIPAVNIDPFLNSMSDRVIRAEAIKEVSQQILEAFKPSREDAGSAVVVYTWETFPKNTADILALVEKITKSDRLVLFHKPADDLSPITDLLNKRNRGNLTAAQITGLQGLIENKHTMLYEKLTPKEINEIRKLEQGLSVLLKNVAQLEGNSVGGIHTKFVVLLNDPAVYEKFDGLPDLVREVAGSLARLDSIRRQSSKRADVSASALEKEILDRISRFGFVSGTDGWGGQIISFNLAVFLQRVQESYNALMQTSIAA